MKKQVVLFLLLTGLAGSAVLARAENDFSRFSKEMLEPTKKSLQVEISYHDCLLKAAGKEDYFTCRDNRDKALNLSGRGIGQMLNPDRDFVWDDDVRSLYIGVSERAIQGKKDTIYCLEQVSTMAGYEQCLTTRRTSRQP